MRLPDESYSELLDCVRGHSVGLVVNHFGNFGDELIQRGTLELLRRHGVPTRLISDYEFADDCVMSGIALVIEPGGGSIGTRPGLSSPRRRASMAALPHRKVVFPQTASDAGEDLTAFDTVFARELTTWRMLRQVHRDVRLAPDLALSLDLPAARPKFDEGTFLRCDGEQLEPGIDPVDIVATADEYVELAGSYRCVRTNRLHFAIAAALQGGLVVLKPGNYHKNRSMYDTWLHAFANVSWEA